MNLTKTNNGRHKFQHQVTSSEKKVPVKSGYYIIIEMMAGHSSEYASGLSNTYECSRINTSATADCMHLHDKALQLLSGMTETASHFVKGADKHAVTLLLYRAHSQLTHIGPGASPGQFYLYFAVLLDRAIKVFFFFNGILGSPLRTGDRAGTLHDVDLKLAAEYLASTSVAVLCAQKRNCISLRYAKYLSDELIGDPGNINLHAVGTPLGSATRFRRAPSLTTGSGTEIPKLDKAEENHK